MFLCHKSFCITLLSLLALSIMEMTVGWKVLLLFIVGSVIMLLNIERCPTVLPPHVVHNSVSHTHNNTDIETSNIHNTKTTTTTTISSTKTALPNPWKNPQQSFNDANNAQGEYCGGVSGARDSIKREAADNKELFQLLKKETLVEWPDFSPTRKELESEKNDLRKFYLSENNKSLWERIFRDADRNLTEVQLFLNGMNLVLNDHLVPQPNHVPIVMRTYKRIEPLKTVLRSICEDVQNINETTLIISIDGSNFKGVIETIVAEVTCVFTRIVWHPFFVDQQDFKIDNRFILTAHFAYVLQVAFNMDYPYAICLEDDLLPGPDYYNYHKDLWPLTKDRNILAIASYSHGPIHDCKYLKQKMQHEGECRANDPLSLIKDKYFPGWGAGIPKHTFILFMQLWTRKDIIWDVLLSQMSSLDNYYVIIPCMPRIRYLPNAGTNGNGSERWEFSLRQELLVRNVSDINFTFI